MYLLDTNVLSELRRPGKADVGVRRWADALRVTNSFISVVSVLEIELGTLRVSRKDPASGAVLRAWVDQTLLPRYQGRVLPIDTQVARRCAALHVPDPKSERDALIAATALVHGMTVVTRNVADFEATGVLLLNPWLA